MYEPYKRQLKVSEKNKITELINNCTLKWLRDNYPDIIPTGLKNNILIAKYDCDLIQDMLALSEDPKVVERVEAIRKATDSEIESWAQYLVDLCQSKNITRDELANKSGIQVYQLYSPEHKSFTWATIKRYAEKINEAFGVKYEFV